MKKSGGSVVLCLILSLVAVVFFTACSTGVEPVKSSEYGDQENETAESLTISYKGEDVVISMEEILKLDEIIRDATPVPKDGEEKATKNVKGVLLEDVFQEFLGISQNDPQAILLLAGDGYSIEVSKDLLDTKEIMLAYEIDGKPLEGWEKPLRSVVPDVFEMYWVKNLTRIEIIESREESQVVRIIMMDTRISDIPDQDYKYNEENDRAVKVDDLLFNFNEEWIQDAVFVMGVDGLEKNEKSGNFLGAFIKFTGQDSPMFLSEDLPKGMWIKKILYFVYGGSAYFSTASGFEIMDRETIEGQESIRLADILSRCDLAQSDKYLFKALDDYSVEIESDSIELGHVYFQENGLPAVYFEGLPENTEVKDLIYIGISE
jgi:hypothetical protein